MRKHHPDNERIKRRYLTYLEEAHSHGGIDRRSGCSGHRVL
jgi:hypothetical protein